MSIKDKYSAQEFNELMNSKVITQNKKGRFVSNIIPPIEKEIKGNKKIRNAEKIVHDGLTFDSTLELNFYLFLTEHNIKFERQIQFELQPKFTFLGKIIRPITITIDFLLPEYNLYIDTKGFPNDVFPVKVKMWKYKAISEQWNSPGNEPALWYIRNKGQFYLVLNFIQGQVLSKSDVELLTNPKWK